MISSSFSFSSPLFLLQGPQPQGCGFCFCAPDTIARGTEALFSARCIIPPPEEAFPAGGSLPRRRKPSPPGKVDRAQPGTDEGRTSPAKGPGPGEPLWHFPSIRVFRSRLIFPSSVSPTASHLPRRGRLPPGGGAFHGFSHLLFACSTYIISPNRKGGTAV